jgi:PKD repeat protein/glucose/arabinose dehydrogenase
MVRNRFDGAGNRTHGVVRATSSRPPRHRRGRRRGPLGILLSLLLLVGTGILAVTTTSSAQAATLPAGFQESVVFSGLTNPTVVRFADDGRVFVAEKRGVIKVFDSLTDTTPTTFADLNVNVYNFWDRGLLGMALAPNFPTDPSVYVLYTYDHELGSMASAPRWGTAGVYSDPCPTPPGATGDGCVVSARLSRLQAAGNVMTGSELVLVEDWCQQYPSHSIGTVEFGEDGALYASGGDGASFNFTDWGQDGNPANPCGDPPGGVGATLTPPTAEGGALRSQDLRTLNDPVGLDGTIIRVDPATGAGLPGNPMAQSADANARRIIAQGMRNPFRFAPRPNANELWVGDVGWNDWEEINILPVPTVIENVENFGWPCYEGGSPDGAVRQAGYDGANLSICENLYSAGPGAVTVPYFAYHHSARVVPNETCPTGSSSIAGLEFEFAAAQNSYPTEYDDALFFADYSRDCIWVMQKGADGKPAPGLIRSFVSGAANPVNLENGPGGDLFYVDFDGGTIRRIIYTSAPMAVATANPTTGPAPLTVAFDGTGSSDPNGDPLSFAWDLDGDGAYDDSTATRPSYTYSAAGSYTATLRVTDSTGASDTDSVTITVGGNTAPTAVITTPTAGTTWKVGDVITFSGSATDAQDGNLPASALAWDLIMHHCPSTCHTHLMQEFDGTFSGSFTAPDHEYPSYLELTLTATDSGGLTNTKSVRLDPKTVVLTFQTSPGGLLLVVDGASSKAPITRTVIVGSKHTISATSPQSKGSKTYVFMSWSDGGGQTHDIVAPATATTYTARFQR